MPAAIVPFVHVKGSWDDMGEQVGQMFAPLIARHVDTWLQHVITETGCTPEAAFATAATFAAPIQKHAPFLWEELEGMARGAHLPLADLQGFYRDHAKAPHSLCAEPWPGRNVQTVVSLIGDLTARQLYVAKGSPCRAAHGHIYPGHVSTRSVVSAGGGYVSSGSAFALSRGRRSTRYRCTKASSTSIPKPGASGSSIQPLRKCISGLADRCWCVTVEAVYSDDSWRRSHRKTCAREALQWE